MQGSIEEHLSSLSANGVSENTVRAYRADLLMWAEWMQTNPTANLEEAARSYITAIRKTYKPKTTVRKITAIRSYGRFRGLELLKDYKAPKPMRSMPHPIPEGIDGIMRMVETGNTNQQKALVALCGLCGLRVAEALEVQPSDIDLDEMMIRVRGKGDKERLVPLSKNGWGVLAPAVVDATLKGGKVVPYSNRAARAVITACGKRAGLSRQVSSHDLRSTFATAAYDRTRDLRVVQELLGHSNSATTEGYTLASSKRMRDATELVDG